MTRNLPLPGTVSNFDVVGSSDSGHPRHAELADAAKHVIGDAIAAAPAPNAWVRSPRGAGEFSVAPASVPAAWLLADFLNQVYEGARRYNRDKRDGDQLRLRVGIDYGDVLINGRGDPRGDPLVNAARLQESPAARAAADAVPAAPLVAVVSDLLYQRVVPRDTGLRAEAFREVAVEIEGETVRAWLYVPHFPLPSVDGEPKEAHSAGPKYDTRIKKSKGVIVGDGTTAHFTFGSES